MSDKELDNFILKFHQLRRSGFTAHLDIDTHAGQAWVGLRLMLGPVHQEKQSKAKKHRSPSYLRRLEKRKLARSAASPNKGTEEVSTAVDADEANNGADNEENADKEVSDSVKDAEKASDNADKELKVSDKDAEKAAEKSHNAVNRYRCEIVTVSKQDATLEKHMSQKHQFIEQIDGNVSQQSIEEQPKTLPQDRLWRPQKGSDEYRILVAENFKLLREEIEKYPPMKEKLMNEFKAKPDMFISWYQAITIIFRATR